MLTKESRVAAGWSQPHAHAMAVPLIRKGELIVGISGVSRNAAVAGCVDGELVAACEQERITRIRGIGLQPGRFPQDALDVVLRLAGDRVASDVRQFATAEDELNLPSHIQALRFEHHFAHAVSALRLSPFHSATVLVCDHHSSPPVTVWRATEGKLAGIDWPCGSTSLARLYSEATRLFGFAAGQEHRLEALARLDGSSSGARFEDVIRYEDGLVWASSRWRAVLAEWLVEDTSAVHRIRVAGAFQRHLGRMLLALVSDVRANTGDAFLCLGGGLFYNTFFTTLVYQSGPFEDVFVAPNPGNAGLAVGIAMAAGTPHAHVPKMVSPFLGPEYGMEEIKATLDNCKLSYECLSDQQVVDRVVAALVKGRLVGWFQGRMEWAHRALGNRSILASPLSPYVLDNLNVFLKRRERHLAYGFSTPETEMPRLFDGPRCSRYMEYEYRPWGDSLRHSIPAGAVALRVQTVPHKVGEFRRFLALHTAFGETTGVPVLVNTSFNGFSEPIVASPRDAIRVFFSTGLDVLVMDRFVIQK